MQRLLILFLLSKRYKYKLGVFCNIEHLNTKLKISCWEHQLIPNGHNTVRYHFKM